MTGFASAGGLLRVLGVGLGAGLSAGLAFGGGAGPLTPMALTAQEPAVATAQAPQASQAIPQATPQAYPQMEPGALLSGDPRSLAANDLDETTLRFGQALGQGNADALSRFFSESGIRLRLQGLDRTAMSVRQVHAALRDFLRGYEPGQVRKVRAAPVEGNPGRGFAELHWQTRVVGTSHPVAHTLFLGLVLEGESWRVDEFRLLP